MKKYVFIMISFAICLCRDGNNRIEEEIRLLHGSTIDFVQGYEPVTNDSTSDFAKILRRKHKVVSYVDYYSCTSCMIKNFSNNADEIHEQLGKSIPYVLVIYTPNIEMAKKQLEEHNINAYIILYNTKKFEEENKLDVLACNKTFLTNSENKVLVVGEPFGDKKRWSVYKKALASFK